MCDVPHIRLYHIRLCSFIGAALAARSPGSLPPPKSVVFGGCSAQLKSPAAGQLKGQSGVIIVLCKPGDMAIDAD
jgi:hypothetical protein